MEKKNNAAYIYLLLTFIFWGSSYVAGKYLLGYMPPFTILFLRFSISVVCLYFIIRKRKLNKIERKDYKYIALIGVGCYFISVGAQFIGTKLAGASLASLINSMSPILIMVAASVILKEKLSAQKIAGMVLALTGIYFIIGAGEENGQIWGIASSIFAVLIWSVVSVVVRKMTQKYDPMQITFYCFIIAAACNLPVSAAEVSTSVNMHIDIWIVLSVLYLSIVCTCIAYILWNKSLSILEAGTCSALYPIQPLVSILLGAILLNEAITASIITGAVLIVSGVLISLLMKNKKAYSARAQVPEAVDEKEKAQDDIKKANSLKAKDTI